LGMRYRVAAFAVENPGSAEAGMLVSCPCDIEAQKGASTNQNQSFHNHLSRFHILSPRESLCTPPLIQKIRAEHLGAIPHIPISGSESQTAQSRQDVLGINPTVILNYAEPLFNRNALL
jgi:hypothetical protein